MQNNLEALSDSKGTISKGEKILITGASGFIGTHLARRLSEAGANLFCLDMRPPRQTLTGAQYISADIRSLSSLDLPTFDRIYNLAAIHTTPGHPDHEYYDTNVNGALEVARKAERDGTRHIIFTSSISIYGPSEEKKVETTPPAPVSAYGKSKLMAEKIHQNWLGDHPDRKLTIVRPAVVFGAGEGGNFARMAALLKKGFFVFPGRRDTIKSCIYVEDLIDLFLSAGNTDGRMEILNGSYPECPTLEFIVTTLRDNYFPGAKLIDVPREVVMLGAKTFAGLNGVGLGVHPDRVMKLIRSTYVYPGWAADRNFFERRTFVDGLAAWSKATKGTFI